MKQLSFLSMKRSFLAIIVLLMACGSLHAKTALAHFGQFSKQPWQAQYSTSAYSNWYEVNTDDSSWKSINGPVSSSEGLDYSNFEPGEKLFNIICRRHFTASNLNDEEYIFYVTHTNCCVAYLNGHEIYNSSNSIAPSECRKIFVSSEWLKTGDNLLAVRCYSNSSYYSMEKPYLDFGLYGEDRNWLDVDLATPGSLGREILYQVDVLGDVELLRVKGNMNDDDWTAISNMANVRELDLSQAKAENLPNNLLSGHKEFHSILLPQNLKTIGDNAFRETKLTDISIPASVNRIGSGTFYGDNWLTKVEFPSNSQLTDIGTSAFRGCKALLSVKLPNGITKLEREIFSYCYALSSVILPSALQSIGNSCFFQVSALKNIDFPQTLGSIGVTAFYQAGLESVVLPQNITYLGSQAFSGCRNLKKVELPITAKVSNGESYSSGGYYSTFTSCTALEKVVCHSATPPLVANSTPFNEVDLSKVTLEVPAFAVVDYKLSTYWHNFGKIVEGAEPSLLNIGSTLTLTNNRRPVNKVDILLSQDGCLTVGGNAPLEVGTMTFTVNRPNKSYGQLLNQTSAVSADLMETKYRVYANGWYFITPLHDININDISHSDANAAFIFRYYNSENRANNGPKGSWQNLTENVIHSGQGYILQTNREGWITLPATSNGKAAALVSTDAVVALKSYRAANEVDANWNYVGNPYPCYYDTYYMDLAAPITVRDYDNNTYRAYSPIDDNYVLSPMEAFFVQKPDGLSQILFQEEGRQFAPDVQRSASTRKVINDNRLLFDIEVTDGTHSDFTRLVLSPQASLAYEPAVDVTKFFSQEATVPQLYTLNAEGDALAINQRPVADGIARLGLSASVPGTYSIKLSRGPGQLLLFDTITGQTTDISQESYYFSIDEVGIFDQRFVLNLGTTSIQSVEDMQQQNGHLYDLQGRPVNNLPSKGIYVKKGKKYVVK